MVNKPLLNMLDLNNFGSWALRWVFIEKYYNFTQRERGVQFYGNFYHLTPSISDRLISMKLDLLKNQNSSFSKHESIDLSLISKNFLLLDAGTAGRVLKRRRKMYE